jgi:diguanylate cyclase (GGDEF)-like protein
MLFAFCKNAITALFIKEEIKQNEILKNYSANVSKTLDLKAIFHSTVKAVVDATDITNVYIGLPDSADGNFRMRYSYQSLADLSFVLRKDNPIVQWLEKNDELLNMDVFANSASYKSMWENEKFHLMKMKITCCVGLKDNQQLVGVILLSDFGKKVKLKENDLNVIASIGAVASIAIKNAHTYEKAYLEARTDHLTGVLNRRYFYEALNNSFQENIEGSLALIIINIDDFKLFNQLYGVKTGDLMLKKIADLIKATVGASNYVARYGGKEFAVILPGYDVFSAKKITESIRDQIAQLGSEKGEYHQKRLTISAGISVSPYGARTVKELVDNADQAVYQVKRKGKNAIKVFDTFVHTAHNHENDLKYLNAYDEYKSTIYALTAAIDAKDHYTFSHSDNVATYATELAMALNLNSEIVENIRQAALLHDIGKISIPESILNKPGK